MPIHLPAHSRRRFLAQLAGGVFAIHSAAQLSAAEAEGEKWVLFSDTHVAADRMKEARGVNMAANLERAVKAALAKGKAFKGVFVNGDCAFNTGEAEDYATFTGLIDPLRQAGLPVHLTLGNHDHRENIRKGLKEAGDKKTVVTDKQVSIVEGKAANWFLLDTLELVNKTPGLLGEAQLEWLQKELDARKDKPAIVMMHHNPDLKEKPTGLKDTAKLLEVLAPRKQVKALFYGHSHTWSVTEHESGIHQINLPAVAYVFNQAMTNGWVEVSLAARQMTLRLNAFNDAFADNGKDKVLTWRS
ncbi:MAG: metallophosphoesterase family protein [Verrucomicrobiota bacterium]